MGGSNDCLPYEKVENLKAVHRRQHKCPCTFSGRRYFIGVFIKERIFRGIKPEFGYDHKIFRRLNIQRKCGVKQ